MSSTDRQNRLLLAEDWKRVYQSYKNAEFKSYDFDTIRRTMIQYIRQNYPEDFNDYIESSEYLALIDLIAYLGQNLAFRTDLNARENFLETVSPWIRAYHLSENDGLSDSNKPVTKDSWFWPYIKKNLDYYSLEVYGNSPQELFEQLRLTESQIKINVKD